jgi:hypothetical protein
MGDGAVLTVASNLAAEPRPIAVPRGQTLFATVAAPAGLLPGHCTCALLDEAPNAND